MVASCDFLRREYDALPGPDDGVELWETYHLALQGKRNLALGRATSNTQVVAAMQKLAETNDFTTWNQESDDPESVSPIYFVPWFGKK